MAPKIYVKTDITISVSVDYSYFRHHSGHCDSLGFKEEPDEPAHDEIDFVKYNGKDLELTQDDLEALELDLLEEIECEDR